MTDSNDAGTPPANGNDGGNTPAPQGKLFTQADIDAIVEDRLGRDRRTREEALAKELGMSLKDAKALIKARKAEEDAQKSELQREREARAAAEKERDALKAEREIGVWRSKYGKKHNIPEADWDRLRGSTESEIEEDAKAWAKARGLDKAGGPTPRGGNNLSQNPFNQAFLAATGRGGR